MKQGDSIEYKVHPDNPDSQWVKGTIKRVYGTGETITLILVDKEDGFLCHRLPSDVRTPA